MRKAAAQTAASPRKRESICSRSAYALNWTRSAAGITRMLPRQMARWTTTSLRRGLLFWQRSRVKLSQMQLPRFRSEIKRRLSTRRTSVPSELPGRAQTAAMRSLVGAPNIAPNRSKIFRMGGCLRAARRMPYGKSEPNSLLRNRRFPPPSSMPVSRHFISPTTRGHHSIPIALFRRKPKWTGPMHVHAYP